MLAVCEEVHSQEAYPSTAQSVQVGATDTTVANLDVDVGLFPRLGLKLLPDHLALTGFGTEAHPALKLVIGGRHYVIDDVQM